MDSTSETNTAKPGASPDTSGTVNRPLPVRGRDVVTTSRLPFPSRGKALVSTDDGMSNQPRSAPTVQTNAPPRSFSPIIDTRVSPNPTQVIVAPPLRLISSGKV